MAGHFPVNPEEVMLPTMGRSKSGAFLMAVGVVLGGSNAAAQGATGAPAKVQVEAQLVGPADPNALFSISRHGAHLGTVIPRGAGWLR